MRTYTASKPPAYELENEFNKEKKDHFIFNLKPSNSNHLFSLMKKKPKMGIEEHAWNKKDLKKYTHNMNE